MRMLHILRVMLVMRVSQFIGRLAALAACAVCVGQTAVEEVRANTRTLLHESFSNVVQSIQDRFATEDHALIVGRKLSVDWSLAPALLMCEIARGDPPSHWMATLDDAYGNSAVLADDAPETPRAIVESCALIAHRTGIVRFSSRAERSFAAGSEVPPLIAWECEIDRAQTRLRTAWYEPSLAQRGVDFPMPADRTLLTWTSELMRLQVLQESADWSMPWPKERPIFDHVGDAYDLFDGLRAWHWARRQEVIASKPALISENTDGKFIPRTLRWTQPSCDEWQLTITLRPCWAIRTAGFTVTADGVDRSKLPIGRPNTLVEIIAPHTTLRVSFVRLANATVGIAKGTFLPSRLALLLDDHEIAHASLQSIVLLPAEDSSIVRPLTVDPLWRDAVERIRQAQDSQVPPIPFDASQLDFSTHTANGSNAALLRARLAANAWMFGLRADIANLTATITHAQELRRTENLGRHDLTDLQTFAESMALAHAADSVISAVRIRHTLAAAELQTSELIPACLAAASSGRFWAALDIATVGSNRAIEGSQAEVMWRRARESIRNWCADPLSYVVFGADSGVLILSQHIAAEINPTWHDSIAVNPPPTTIDGRAAGGAMRELRAIFDDRAIEVIDDKNDKHAEPNKPDQHNPANHS